MTITKQQARRFILRKQGLLGKHLFVGKQGALSYVRGAGCIQFDPVDVCGKNAELTLQSRVRGCSKQMLFDLLYQDRALVDYTDKQLAIFPVEDWPYFARTRALAAAGNRRSEDISPLKAQALAYIAENGPVSSEELPIEGQLCWRSAIHWSGGNKANAARSVLEQLYSEGVLVIHHKKGTRKVYDLAERHIAQSILTVPDPLPDDFDHLCWRVLRRIGAVGLLWDRPSDAWLGLSLETQARHQACAALCAAGQILPVQVEGIRAPLYLRAEDEPLLREVLAGETYTPRCEFLAPLDPFLWDRKLIKALFDFAYSWEIYTPPEKRKYGYYVLPVLWGEGFAGRIEAAAKGSTLFVKNIWFEENFAHTKRFAAALEKVIARLAKFNDCSQIQYEKDRL